jgi:hypothetical protein
MTTPIKPPGGGAPKGLEAPSGAEPEAAKKADAFDRALGDAQASAPAKDTQAAVTAKLSALVPSDALAALAADVRAGKVVPGALVDLLVTRALEAVPAASLSEQGKAKLEATLRAALSEDPTLSTLMDRATQAQ